MLVRCPGILNQRCGLLVALAKGHERPGIEPERTAVLMRSEQLLERAVVVLLKEAPGEDVSNSLIVVRVQLQHIAVMGEWTCFGKVESSPMSGEELEDAAATVYERI